MGAGAMMQQVPPPPPGFVPVSQAGAIPPPPPGFMPVSQAPVPARPPANTRPAGNRPATPAPLNALGITDEEEIAALTAQYGSSEEAMRLQAERVAADPNYDPGMAPAQPALADVAASSGFELPEGVVDWNTLTDDQRRGLKRGARIMLPQREGETFRQIATLSADMDAPSREDLPGDVITEYDGFRTREGQIADVIGGLTSGAAEQFPLMDEAVTGLDALVNRRSFSESRDRYRDMVGALNQQQRGARNVGGVLGFGGTMLLPGLGGAAYIRGARAAGPLTQGGLLAERAGQIGRAMQVGGATGAVYGGTAAEGGAGERLQGAGTGLLFGAGTGGVIQGATPAIASGGRRLLSGFSEAGAVIGRGFGRVAPEVEITPEATAAAREYVSRLARSSGSDLANNPLEAMGLPITTAEAIGGSGVANVAALSRRSGRASNLVGNQIGARAVERPNQVVQDLADLTGIDPAGSADMVDNIVTAGRQRAAPLWAAVEELQVNPTPMMNDILRRPSGRAALRRAYRIARDEGVNPETLGLFVMEAGDGGLRTGASSIARDADTIADLNALRAGRGVRGDGRGETLLEFISKNGGVRDDGGELAQIGADTWNRQGSWRSRAVRDDGLSLEQMADRARAAGFFSDVADATAEGSENYQRISSQDMINALEGELRGYPSYARAIGDTDRSAAAVARRARREALDERLMREGIDINKSSNDEILRRIRDADDAEARIMAQLYGEGPDAPQIELVPGEVPSVRTLDYVRRGLNQVLEGKRDRTTRRLVVDDETRPIIENVARFRDELISATGGESGVYAQALAESGDYLRVEDAFRRSEKLFQTGTPMRAFESAIERMGEAERNALIAGFADKLFRDAQSGAMSLNRMQQLTVPVTREKLAALLDPQRADDFIRRVTARIELSRSGSRMAPGTNSITSEVQAAIDEQDGRTGWSADFARNLVGTGKIDPFGAAVLTAGKAAVAPVAGFFRGVGNPQNTATRDEMARLFMLLPSEAQAELTAVASRPEPGLLAKSSQAFVAPGGGLLGSAFAPNEPRRARQETRPALR